MSQSIFQFKTVSGAPMAWRAYTLTPRARLLRVRLPRGGGLVWNRPTALVVECDGAPAQTLPVRDPTRIAQIAIAACALACTVLIGWARRRESNP